MDNLDKKFALGRGGKYFALLFLCLYLLAGIGVFRDYSISTDEPNERRTMYINVNYVMTLLGRESMDVPELRDYEDKYYGIFLQLPTAAFEIGHGSTEFIYGCRHLYTFGICVIGYIAFYCLCRKIFASGLTAILGTAMVALYPRFFAEQFYNIKDMFFLAVYMAAMWSTYEVIENKFQWKQILLFSFLSALATNVRIVGIIFILLLVGYAWLVCLTERMGQAGGYGLTVKKTLILSLSVFILYFVFLIMMYPAAWESPVRTVIEMFTKFSNYDDWTGAIVFMGKIISKEEIPWYYIPVWMLISLPIWYILVFLMTAVLAVCRMAAGIGKKGLWTKLLYQYKYFLWAGLLVLIPWGIVVIKHASLYNGWRHCYFLVPPLVLLGLYGLDYVRRSGKRKFKAVVFGLAALGMIVQLKWIWTNHPYEMVYFNEIGRIWASGFDRDYWHMAEAGAVRYILENDASELVTINSTGTRFSLKLLTEEERNRIEVSEEPMYFIETYRGKIGNELSMPGYEEFYSIVVDGFKIATVFKRTA